MSFALPEARACASATNGRGADASHMNQGFPKSFSDRQRLVSLLDHDHRLLYTTLTAVYGTGRTVVWKEGGREPASYPILAANGRRQ